MLGVEKAPNNKRHSEMGSNEDGGDEMDMSVVSETSGCDDSATAGEITSGGDSPCGGGGNAPYGGGGGNAPYLQLPPPPATLFLGGHYSREGDEVDWPPCLPQ